MPNEPQYATSNERGACAHAPVFFHPASTLDLSILSLSSPTARFGSEGVPLLTQDGLRAARAGCAAAAC
jgi:hypothetical protein